MNRRGFLGALIATPVVAAVARLPVLMTQTPQAAVIRAARAEYRGNCWYFYDNQGKLRVQLGTW